MAKMTGLGKGLDALFSSSPVIEEEEKNENTNKNRQEDYLSGKARGQLFLSHFCLHI